MKVKIINAGSPDYWYADKIGKEMQVKEFDSLQYKLDSGENIYEATIYALDKVDCQVIYSDEPRLDTEDNELKFLCIKIACSDIIELKVLMPCLPNILKAMELYENLKLYSEADIIKLKQDSYNDGFNAGTEEYKTNY